MLNLTKYKASLSGLTQWARQGFADQGDKNLDLLNTKANMTTGRFVASQEELDQTKNSPPNQGDIFNSWYRYSHQVGNEAQPALPDETLTWTYSSVTDVIQNTTNSSSSIGIVSPGKYDQYLLDAKLSSTHGDDDTIGLVLAWYVDPLTKREHTLTLVRSPGGSGQGNLYAIWYNHLRTDRVLIANMGPLVTWGNGANGGLSLTEAGWVSNTPGWGTTPTYWSNTGGTRLKAVRNGDVFTVTTSQWASSDTLDPTTEFELDLKTNPLLEKFRGPCSYGFMTQSQANSRWSILNFTNPQEYIYDLKNDQVWEYVDDVWVIKAGASIDDIKPRRLLYNPTTKKMFYFHDRGSIVRVSTSNI